MTKPAEDPIELLVRDQAVKAIHGDFNSRYNLDAIRDTLGPENIHLLQGITQSDIDTLKEFFFNTIYPEMGGRLERDKSFDSMMAMLRNPSRLGRLIPSLPSIILRYAMIWPTALNVGLNAMMAYILSLRIEALFTKEIRAMMERRGVKIDENFVLDAATYAEAYCLVPQSHGRRMISAAVRVMRAGREPRLVKSTYNIMLDVQNSLARVDSQRKAAGAPPLYTDPIRAIDFGKRVLAQVDNIFGAMGKEKTSRIISVTQILETRHLEKMYAPCDTQC